MSFWNSRYRKARKEHRCEYCGKKIKIGETYSRETGIYEGDFNDYAMCARCRAIWHDMTSSWSDELGEFRDDLFENDLVMCPACGSVNRQDYDFAEDMQSVTCECLDCGREYTVDLSAEAILAVFAERKARRNARKEEVSANA